MSFPLKKDNDENGSLAMNIALWHLDQEFEATVPVYVNKKSPYSTVITQ